MLNKLKERQLMPLIALLVALGILLSGLAFRSSRREMEDADGQQLLDMVENVDYSMNRVIHHIEMDLDALVTDKYFIEGLDQYLRTGSTDLLKEQLSDLSTEFYPVFSPVIVSFQEKILYASDNSSESAYTFPDGFVSDGICVCKTDSNFYYLAVSNPVPERNAILTVMVELNDFYSQIASKALDGEYWLVLYDQKSNVFLQNDITQPSYIHRSREEALARNDGYRLLALGEQKQEIQIGTYRFQNNGEEEVRNLMAVIPSSQSLNRYFAVGLARDGTKIRQLILKTYGHLFMGLLMIFAGFVCLSALFLKSNEENAQKQSRMSELEDENREMQLLLDKSRELEHVQRLETIGTMTSSIAHEFNNLLTPIMGYSMMLIQKMQEEDPENMDELFEIYTSASKAKEVIERLSSLSRKNTGASYKLLVPNELATRTLSLARTAAPENTTIHSSFRCQEPCLEANEVQIVQVLLNLILNSFQAMDDRPGDIYLSTWREGDSVYFRTEDTAGGIAEENLAHIFEPFFTTKAPSEGTGLGLPIVNQIIKEHSGSITLENRPGEGCTFTVKLPAAEKEKNVELS